MTLIESIVLGLYFAIMAVLSIYGSHRYFMAYLYHRHKFKLPTPSGPLKTLPKVTIQLPIFNEMYVVERLIGSVSAIQYPSELLQIQVLDDSTDETVHIAKSCVDRYRARGVNIEYIHRDNRSGFKAGALEHGLLSATGEFVAIFDADFIPSADFLQRTLPFFSDDKTGMVQVRWGHINRTFSPLTQAQSILLDGHFVIEHTARNRSGRFFNFNGTAGIWRRTTIADAGGWQHDTLTEDLDLSYRAQLKGWKFLFLNDVESPAEVPVEMNAFKSQQHRWAKGSIQTMRKLLPTLLRSNVSSEVKKEAFMHLSANLAYLLMVLLSVLMPVCMVIRFRHGWYGVLLLDFPFFITATASVCFFYATSQREVGQSWWQSLRYVPFVMALGIGMSLNNAKAVIEALLNQQSAFTRTPKLGAAAEGQGAGSWTAKKYRGKSLGWLPWTELVLGAYMSYSVWFALTNEIWFSLPFLILFQVGFLYVGLMSLLQGRLQALTAGEQPAGAPDPA
jgi:cellulose synthase/poly-beta-1,6-N-acetylglucosamine synthase-like glycosyltransferase